MPNSYPQVTTPDQNDTVAETAHKILRVIDEARSGASPLKANVTGSGSTPPAAITATANVKFGAAAGTGITHVLPASPSTGGKAEYLITASGGNWTVSFAAAIVGGVTQTVASGSTVQVVLEYNGAAWQVFLPTPHKSTHATGGSDALAPSDIGAATAAQGTKADAAVPSTRTINSVDLSANRSLADLGISSVRVIKTTDFAADINGRYTVSGTATVTDPAGTTAGQIYSVVIGSGTATIGGVAYAPSRVEVIREYSGSAWVTLAPVLADNTTLNGTANTAPNELSASDSSLLTRINADGRYIDKLKTIQLNPACAFMNTSAGGAASLAAAGCLQLLVSTTASSYAGGGFNLQRTTGQTALSFSDRIILSTTYSGTPRSGLAIYFQIGKTAVDSSQLNKKGFGLSITLSGVTPYVHNGTSLTSGSTYSASAYNRFVLDFRPGVSLDLYGVTYKGVSTLLGSVSTGLPAGTGITNDTNVDFVASDSGSGGTGAFQWFSNMMISFQ